MYVCVRGLSTSLSAHVASLLNTSRQHISQSSTNCALLLTAEQSEDKETSPHKTLISISKQKVGIY